MRRCTRLLLAGVAALIVAAPASAITRGSLDGTAHPAVGLLLADRGNGPEPECSGSLVSPTVTFRSAVPSGTDTAVGTTGVPFLSVFCLVYVLYVPLAPWDAMRYLCVLLPATAVLLGWVTCRVFQRSRAAGAVLLLALTCTDALGQFPLDYCRVAATRRAETMSWSVNARRARRSISVTVSAIRGMSRRGLRSGSSPIMREIVAVPSA